MIRVCSHGNSYALMIDKILQRNVTYQLSSIHNFAHCVQKPTVVPLATKTLVWAFFQKKIKENGFVLACSAPYYNY